MNIFAKIKTVDNSICCGIDESKSKIHSILAHSYGVYLIAFVLGISLDFVFNMNISDIVSSELGFLFMMFASLLIYWAQYTSRNLKVSNATRDDFRKGPYFFTRTPTNFGLFFLMVGFGMVIGSLFTIILATIAFFVTKFTLLKRQEDFLYKKYGEPYLEYKKLVRF